ncbi:MAG TPA: protein DA1 [Candidatus Acidoferrum sp.]|nr:protein DA1 [Candidatus Acidoferrum sp.]
MQNRTCLFARLILLAGLFLGTAPAKGAEDLCAVCGRPIQGTIYITTDKVTDEKKLLCAECIRRPRCAVCGLPVKEDDLRLPDGRYLCARDARTAVVQAADAERVCGQVKDDLDRLFSRFTAFPANVDVSVIDRIDVDSMFSPDGNDFESPNLLGCVRPETVNQQTRYKMRLMTGLPLAELKATCAHEFTHAWVGENVPKERRAGLGRDAEEGFCELVAYLLMDSQGEEAQKKFIRQNRYTRGQINLFIEADKNYGFDQVLDWMKYGVDAQLEAGHVDKLRDVKMPAAKTGAGSPAINSQPAKPPPAPVPASLRLDGVLWGSRPVAIINGQSFLANDLNPVKVGGHRVRIRCLDIQKTSVRIENVDSGKEQELHLSAN